MSSIGSVSPSSGSSGLSENQLNVFSALTGQYLADVTKATISDSEPISMQEYNILLSSAQINTLQINEKILGLDPNLAASFFAYIASASSDLVALFYSEEATFLSETTDAKGREPLVTNINTDNTAIQTAVSDQNKAYNTMSTDRTNYINAINALSSPPTQSQIKAFNDARKAYFDAVTGYNQKVQNTNTANTNYSSAVTSYQSYLTNTVDPEIDTLNAERASKGISPPVPYPTIPSDVDSFSVDAGSAATNLSSSGPVNPDSKGNWPTGEPEQPAALPTISLPTSFPETLTDPTTITLSATEQNFIATALPLYSQWINQQIVIANSETTDNPVGDDYKEKVGTMPIAYIHRHIGATSESGGAQGMTSFITGLDLTSINTLLPHNLYNNFYAGTTAIPSPNLYHQVVLTTVTAGEQVARISSPTGRLYLGEFNNEAPPNSTAINVAVATGNLNTTIGLLNGRAFTTALSALTNSNSALNALTPTEQAQIQESIGALGSNGLLQLNVGSLSQQLSLPETNHVFGVALLAANPTAQENLQIFQQQAHQFQVLGTQYGSQGVISPLTHYVGDQLSQQGVPTALAEQTANQLATSLAQNGLGGSATELQNTINTILEANLGAAAAQQLAPSVFQNVVIFSAAAYQKQATQSALIQQAGPSQASQANTTTLALYGLSVNFNEGTVAYAQSSDQRPNSVVQLVIANNQQLLKTNKQNALNEAYENWQSAAQVNVSLDTFNRTKLMDPGHQITQTGLMAQGTGGTRFKRGQIDLDVSGV